MSVSNTTVRQIYVADGDQVSFPIPFQIIKDEHTIIKVSLADEEGVITPVIGGYTLSPNNSQPTAVVFDLAPEVPNLVIVERTLPLTQVVSYIATGTFNAKDHERAMDRLVMMVQQISERIGATPEINIVDQKNGFNPALAKAIPGAVITINEDGDGFEYVPRDAFKGDKGDQGDSGTMQVGTVGEIEDDDPEPMSVTNVGTAQNAILNFVLRKGKQGDKGDTGDSTVLVTVTDALPDDGVGSNGDMWFFISNGDPDNGNVYQKTLGTYTLKGNIMGPPGGVDTFNGRAGAVVPVASDYSADMVDFDPTGTGLASTDVQAAIAELANDLGVVVLALNDLDAAGVPYDNAASGLTATDVQAAIDEVKGEIDNFESLPPGGTAGQILTKKSATDGDAEWEDPGESLPPGGTTGQVLAKQSATDGDAVWVDPVATAEDVSYNNATSGLAATDVQAAIDETADAVDTALTALAALLVTYAQALNGSANLLLANITGLVETLVIVTTSSTEFNSLNLPAPDRLTKLTIIMAAGNTTTTAITGAVDARATGIRLESGDSMTFVADLTTSTWKLIGRNY